MSEAALANTLSTNDERLIEEALRRLQRNPATPVHDRVRAGQRTIDGLDQA